MKTNWNENMLGNSSRKPQILNAVTQIKSILEAGYSFLNEKQTNE